jgi:uncharacterized protein (DUF2461 family)
MLHNIIYFYYTAKFFYAAIGFILTACFVGYAFWKHRTKYVKVTGKIVKDNPNNKNL